MLMTLLKMIYSYLINHISGFFFILKPSLTDPGMLSWSVRHQEEPEHHPDKTETSSHVEHRLPAQVVRHVASESEDDQSSNTSSRPEYSLHQTFLFLLN